METHNAIASNPRRRARLVLLTAALTLIAACTSTPPSTPPATSIPASPAPPANTAASPTTNPGRLGCAEAFTTQPDSVVFTTVGVGFGLLSKTGADPILASTGNLELSPDAPQYFLKSPVYLKHGVTWAEITLLDGDITFAWVPASVWTGPPGWSLTPYLADTVRLESCNGSSTGFLGGALSPSKKQCVTLGLRSNLHPDVEPFEVGIGNGACD